MLLTKNHKEDKEKGRRDWGGRKKIGTGTYINIKQGTKNAAKSHQIMHKHSPGTYGGEEGHKNQPGEEKKNPKRQTMTAHNQQNHFCVSQHRDKTWASRMQVST